MAAQLPLGQVAASADSVEFSTTYNYPTASVYIELVGRDAAGAQQKVHVIISNGAAGINTANFNGAPIGSFLIDKQPASADCYFHVDATTWTVIGSVT